MLKRTTKLRMRRGIKQKRAAVEGMSVQAEENLDKHFFRRLGRLFEVRRFVFGWIILLVLLASGVTMQLQALGRYHQDLTPVAGGSYTEGMVGNFTNANPIYATGLVDASVAKLLFSSLLKYDSNNQLVGDLAESWTVDAEDTTYTVVLKSGLKWHDGHDLTADDVAFTFKTIQNPDSKSPLFNAWRGIEVKAKDARTVTFTLPNPLAPFVYSLTTGIIPKHSLENIQIAQLRSAPFNTAKPIGSGPFAWDTVEVIAGEEGADSQNVGFKAFADYHAGEPKLDNFVIKTYPNEAKLVDAFQKQEVNSLVGLNNLPDRLIFDRDVAQNAVPLTAEVGAFLKNDSEFLKDNRVRQALVHAVNIPAILEELGYPVIPADEPLLKGQLGYNRDYRQLPQDVAKAKQLLDEAGWKLPEGEAIRANDQTKMSLRFYAVNNADNTKVVQLIQRAWQEVGVETIVTLPPDTELQDIVNGRVYDVLLYGVSIGVDPDVFAYWHSTQADPRSMSRLNFSNYKSSSADKALEAGRSRSDPALRAAKYAPFLQAWRNDAPALMLYQPRFLYITRGSLFGYDAKRVNTASDRFNNVHNWMARQGYVPKQ